MKVMIKETITVVCKPGSVVEIDNDQFAALGKAAEAVVETPAPEKPARKTKEKK